MKTHCKRGHDLALARVERLPSGGWQRKCRECRNIRARIRRKLYPRVTPLGAYL